MVRLSIRISKAKKNTEKKTLFVNDRLRLWIEASVNADVSF